MVLIKKIKTYWLVIFSLFMGGFLTIITDISGIKLGDLLTIASIFIGFYLTLLISINGKIFSIDICEKMEKEQKSYIKRYLDYSNDFVMLVYYGFLSILLSLVFFGLCKIDTGEIVSFILIGVFYSSLSFFATSLIKIIIVLIDFFKEDFNQKITKTTINSQYKDDE